MYSYSDFVSDCTVFIQASEKLRDGWKMTKFDDRNQFVSKRSLINENVSVEYHLLYDHSYNVPTLFINATYLNGRIVKPEDLYTILNISKDQGDVLSQKDHPLLDTPFYYIHPCQTSKMMDNFTRERHTCNNYVYLLTFLSMIGPIAGLKLPHEYSLIIYQNNE